MIYWCVYINDYIYRFMIIHTYALGINSRAVTVNVTCRFVCYGCTRTFAQRNVLILHKSTVICLFAVDFLPFISVSFQYYSWKSFARQLCKYKCVCESPLKQENINVHVYICVFMHFFIKWLLQSSST